MSVVCVLFIYNIYILMSRDGDFLIGKNLVTTGILNGTSVKLSKSVNVGSGVQISIM